MLVFKKDSAVVGRICVEETSGDANNEKLILRLADHHYFRLEMAGESEHDDCFEFRTTYKSAGMPYFVCHYDGTTFYFFSKEYYDARYYQRTQVDGLFTTHASSDDHDGRYYTESEEDTLHAGITSAYTAADAVITAAYTAAIAAAIATHLLLFDHHSQSHDNADHTTNYASEADLTTHKTSSDHDARYYTETELDAGQLDTRYYTETEVDTLESEILAHLMVGSANKQYIACTARGQYPDPSDWAASNASVWRAKSTATRVTFDLPLPTNRGGKKLYVKAWAIGVFDADANNYITRVRILKYKCDTGALSETTVRDYNTDIDSAQCFSENLTANDCSGYTHVYVIVDVTVADDDALDFISPSLEVYYDT